MLQVWFQQDIVPQQIDILAETKARENQGRDYWHWHVRGVEHLNRYMTQLMEVGNPMGKKLHKKLEGDTSKATFGGYMVSSPCLLAMNEGFRQLAVR